MKPEINIIKWHDHWGPAQEWEYTDHIGTAKPAEITSVGFVLREDAVGLEIYQSDGGDQIRGRMYILKSCITKRRKVKS